MDLNYTYCDIQYTHSIDQDAELAVKCLDTVEWKKDSSLSPVTLDSVVTLNTPLVLLDN